MPKFLINKLKDEYGKDSPIPYAVANKEGYMKGSKETEKGKKLEAKHKLDMLKKKIKK